VISCKENISPSVAELITCKFDTMSKVQNFGMGLKLEENALGVLCMKIIKEFGRYL
jgi:hypothetical protein